MNDEHEQDPFQNSGLTDFQLAIERSNYELDSREYQRTSNGLFAMRVFLQFERLSLSQPAWIKQWLVDGFTSYMNLQHSDTLSDLGESLGVPTQSRKDRPTPVEKHDRQIRLDSLLYLMQDLQSSYDIPANMCAELVWNFERASSGRIDSPSSAGRLAKKYSERGCADCLPKPMKRTAEGHRDVLEGFLCNGVSKSTREHITALIAKLNPYLSDKKIIDGGTHNR